MDDGEKSSELDEAAEWYFRRDTGTLSDIEQRRFLVWLNASPRNRQAYDEIEATWSLMGRIERPREEPARPVSHLPAARPRARRALSAVAAVLLVGFLGAFVLDVPMKVQADAYTATGETLEITLADGSTVMLNTATAIAVEFTDRERRIRLLRGEAVFTVAADPARPFLVEADSGASHALGTVFAVHKGEAATRVTVLESRVAVAHPAGPVKTVELGADEQVAYSDTGLALVAGVDADLETAWRRGKLIFVDRPLGSVIDELNRYHAGRIQITDASIRNRVVSGVFETGDPIRVLDAVEASLGLDSTRLTNLLILLHR